MGKTFNVIVVEIRNNLILPFSLSHDFSKTQTYEALVTNAADNPLEYNGVQVSSKVIARIIDNTQEKRFCGPISSAVSVVVELCDGVQWPEDSQYLMTLTYPAAGNPDPVPIPDGCLKDPDPDKIFACQCTSSGVMCDGKVKSDATTAYKIDDTLGTIGDVCSCD